MKKSDGISVRTIIISGAGIVTVAIIALTILSQGSNTIPLPGGLEAGLGTKIVYSDGTSDTTSSKLSLGSVALLKNEKTVETVTYTPYLISQSARTINTSYNIVVTDQSKNVILTKGTNSQVVVTGTMTNQTLFVPPLSITASELLTNITTASNIDLVMIVTIDGKRLQSEIITFEVSNSPTSITPHIPPPPPPIIPTTTVSGGYSTPQPTATIQPATSLQLRVVEISGSFS